jgi:hydrogenase maturation protease
MSARVLLIACGNPLRSDDRMAHQALRQLERDHAAELAGVEIEESHQLTPEMAESASRAERVIILDAHIGIQPGSVSVQRIQPTIAEQVPSGLSHDFDPETLLNTTRALFGASPEVYVVSVGAQHFEHGEALSPEVAAAIPQAVAKVLELIKTKSPKGKKQNA